MKKYFTLVLAVLLSVGLLAGCGSNNDAEYLKDISADKFVTLGQYKGIEITVPAPIVTDEDVEETVSSILMNYPMMEAVSGPGEAGDEVIIDFVGTLDGVAFEGGTSFNYDYTLGSNQFIPDLCEGMIGMSVGDVWDIPVMFPEEYHNPDLAGQQSSFQVTMNSIERPVVISEMTDEYVAWFTEGMYTTASDFRAYIRESMETDAQAAFENEVVNQITETIIENAEFKKLPAAMVKRINDALINSISYYAAMYGLDLETYMMLAGLSSGDMSAEEIMMDQAERTARNYIAFQAIADIEGMAVTDEDVDSGIAELAASMGMTIEEYIVGMDIDSYREYLMIERVSEFLQENAVIIYL
ncbi:MAG: trigger factor [Lachnospiraceae bacterium]|nr:trigger factor [Lachnospiraceae bacterium]